MEREAKAVLVGKVIEEHEAAPEELSHHAAAFVLRLRVECYWKGVKTREVIIGIMDVLTPAAATLA